MCAEFDLEIVVEGVFPDSNECYISCDFHAKASRRSCILVQHAQTLFSGAILPLECHGPSGWKSVSEVLSTQ